MRSPNKTTALVLAASLGLASAAYGLGSQAGGGSAVAESGSVQRASCGPHDRGPALDDFADALGVDAEDLRDALRDFHEERRADGRKAFATALGKALGKSAEEVQAALDELAEQREGRLAGRLAEELGVNADKVSSALNELRDERPRDPSGFAAALAEKLAIDAGEVEDALRAIRPDEPGRGYRQEALTLRQLASALDVTPPELRKAFRDVRADAGSAWENPRPDLVAFLAERLGVSENKVEEALPEFPDPHPGPPDGRPGPGGPGPGGPGLGPDRGVPG
ncbi:MAG: hypothetical protein H0T69_12750 [Thermoleophilaceae bacterium]|nr:hypothetical protein [Thermoleophilaceae bacterium]